MNVTIERQMLLLSAVRSLRHVHHVPLVHTLPVCIGLYTRQEIVWLCVLNASEFHVQCSVLFSAGSTCCC